MADDIDRLRGSREMMEDELRDRVYDNVDWDYNPFTEMDDPYADLDEDDPGLNSS